MKVGLRYCFPVCAQSVSRAVMKIGLRNYFPVFGPILIWTEQSVRSRKFENYEGLKFHCVSTSDTCPSSCVAQTCSLARNVCSLRSRFPEYLADDCYIFFVCFCLTIVRLFSLWKRSDFLFVYYIIVFENEILRKIVAVGQKL